jgi:nucleotide-binding universal stress UspA family protein
MLLKAQLPIGSCASSYQFVLYYRHFLRNRASILLHLRFLMSPLQFRRILAPTDFSDHACHALGYARAFADRWNAELHLLNVIEPAVFPTEAGLTPMGLINLDSELAVAAEHAMTELLKRDELQGLHPVTAIAHGRASSAIIEYAESNAIDIIVIATHGRTGLEHLIFGSTAERVVRESPCPVLTVRPPQQKSQ